jgi:hypothetical protein
MESGAKYVHIAQGRDRWQPFVNNGMNFASIKAGKLPDNLTDNLLIYHAITGCTELKITKL